MALAVFGAPWVGNVYKASIGSGSMTGSELIEWMAGEAERLLRPLGPRWTHTTAVADRARRVAAAAVGIDCETLVAAAYVHDIGYAPDLRVTGHHGIDGAHYLRDLGQDRLAALVAHHSGADAEAIARGLHLELRAFPREESATADALTFCDVTTGHDGREVSLDERVDDVVRRYGEGHVVTRAVHLALPELSEAVTRTQERLHVGRLRAQAMTG